MLQTFAQELVSDLGGVRPGSGHAAGGYGNGPSVA